MVEDSDSSEEEEEKKGENDHHILYLNDDYQDAVINAVWYGKKMPSKRQVQMESRIVATRRGEAKGTNVSTKDQKPTFDSLKQEIINIESFYTDNGLALQREWDFKQSRDKLR